MTYINSRFFTILLYIVLFMNSLYGQRIIFEPMPFLNNLPFNSIFTIYQDKMGYIWIGSVDGVSRYDGYSLQRFSNSFKQPALLTGNDVRCFAEDDRYIWVGTTQGITLIDKENFHTVPFPEKEIAQKEVRSLFRDHRGNIWIGGNDVIYRCNSAQRIEKRYSLLSRSNTFYEDRERQLWVVCMEGNILRYDAEADSFSCMPRCGESNIYRMIQDHDGCYWLATWGNGLWSFHPQAADTHDMYRPHTIVNPIRGAQEQVFYDIIQDDTYGYIWALSHFRLYILRVNEQGELEEVYSKDSQSIDLHKTYSCIIKDAVGNLWIGAFDEGQIVHLAQNEVENFLIKGMEKILGSDPNIIYLGKDSNGVIWFDQARFGLCLYSEKDGRSTYGIVRNDLLYNIDVRVIQLSQDRAAMWLGGREHYSHRVWRAKEEAMRISLLEEIDLSRVTDHPGDVVQIIEDRQNNLYIATTSHLFFRASASKDLNILLDTVNHIVDMHLSRQGNIYVCCRQKIYRLKKKGLQGGIDVTDFDLQSCLLEGEVLESACMDADEHIWVATNLGRLLRFNPMDGQVIDRTLHCGLTGDDILKVLSDGTEWLYIVCSKYIVRHHLKKEHESFLYSVNDPNIFISSFRYGAAFIDADGSLYAGGHKGFIKIHTGNSFSQKSNFPVRITDVRVSGKSLFFDSESGSEENSCNRIQIRPGQRNIEIHFSSFRYNALNHIRYAYRLDGMDKDWTFIENGKNVAFYNKLGKGEYTFRVKSTDVYGRWLDNEQTFVIVRLPAWYETWIAYTAYVLLGLLMISVAVYIYSRSLQMRNRRQLQKELTQIKINHFTNISHELLTPLTVISCAIDALKKNPSHDGRQLSILQDNVNRLKRLIQQILDFWKVENGKMQLRIKATNISTIIQSTIAGNFQPLAHQKGIRLTTQIEKNIYGYIDCDKLDKILFNLLSNATKYTPVGKQVHFIVETASMQNMNRALTIRVADEGIGIEPDELPKIFTKFYNNPHRQGYESNGIGLALTKELVTLHHGTIEVKSELNKGTVFQVELPIGKEVYPPEAIDENAADEPYTSHLVSADSQPDNLCQTEGTDKPTVLFVDDNTDLLELLDSLFSERQKVLTASNGEEGIGMLDLYNIDIIVCDLMMPGMDGMEFCKAVKQNPQTGHIPVIILTAKRGTEEHAESYRIGADSYLTKPFDMKVLQARIDNLLQVCKQRRETFQTDTEINLQDIDYQTNDKRFLQEAIQCVEQHIQDTDFDIEQMAAELCMSRSTLRRKLKALTGLTPLDFVRNIKLKYACTLLKDKTRVDEVTYAIGLSSPKYFAKCFKEAFGLTPSEYQAKCGKE